jgi:hypothetical protein
MYAPKGKMGLTLKFTSQEGHFGTMQMTGGMSRSEELGECRRFWIEERQSVPGFLAQVTTEMFEKTTVSQQFVYPDGRCNGERLLRMDDDLAFILVCNPTCLRYDMTLFRS